MGPGDRCPTMTFASTKCSRRLCNNRADLEPISDFRLLLLEVVVNPLVVLVVISKTMPTMIFTAKKKKSQPFFDYWSSRLIEMHSKIDYFLLTKHKKKMINFPFFKNFLRSFVQLIFFFFFLRSTVFFFNGHYELDDLSP